MKPRLPTAPGRAFLWLGLTFGIAFLFVTPPFQSPDEDNHFYRAFQVSEGGFTADRVGDSNGGSLPVSLTAVAGLHAEVRHNDSLRVSPSTFLDALDEPLAAGKRIEVAFPNTTNYSPVPYAPQAVGIGLGRITGASPLVLSYLGRAANLAAWLALVYCGIRLLPAGGWLAAILALTPMSLGTAPTLSADTVTNGLAFLWIGLFVRTLVSDEQIDGGTLEKIAAVTVALSLCKQPYALLSLLFLVIPGSKWPSRRKHLLHGGVLLAVNLVAAGTWAWVTNNSWVPARLGVPVAPGDQVAFVLEHPLRFLQAVYESHIGLRHAEEFIGVLGWLDTELPVWLLSFQIFVISAAVVCVDDLREAVSRMTALGVLAVGMASVAAVDLALYVSWTAVGAPRIDGIQGRYYIPLSPLLVLAGGLLPFNAGVSARTHRFFFWSVTGILGMTAFILFDRYYVG